MKKIYIAGPLNPNRSGRATEYLENCRTMISAAAELISMGYVPFCPAVDMLYFLTNKFNITDDQIKNYSMVWVEVCDGILLMPGWQDSVGTKKELKLAQSIGLPVFEDIKSVRIYFEGKNGL